MRTNMFNLSLEDVAVKLLYTLIAYLPLITLFEIFIPRAGLAKDIICILICLCVILHGRIQINIIMLGILIYTINVLFALIISSELTFIEKIDAFRYRCEYALTLGLLFNSFDFTKEKIIKIVDGVMRILYLVGLVVAIIGVVEFFEPQIVHSMYGDSLTTHLGLIFSGVREARLISTMGNPINLGLQMNLAIMASLYLMNKKKFNLAKVKKISYLLSIFLFGWIAISTYSRTAYISIAGCVLTFYLAQIFVARGAVKKKLQAIVFIGLMIFVMVMFVVYNDALLFRIGNISIDAFLSNARFLSAYRAFQVSDSNILDYIWGHGIGIFIGKSGHYVFELGYASLLYESGVLGLFIFMIACLKSILSSIKILHLNMEDYLSSAVFLSFIVSFCLAMLTEDVYLQLPFCLYIWLSILVIDNLQNKIVLSNL